MFFFFDDDAKNDEIVEYSQQTFDSIKHYTEDGQEFWYARDLQKVLEYTEWRNFSGVIEKAKIACQNSGIAVDECFVEVNKTSPMPNGGVKEIEDMILSRYACYLIVQNGDPRKEIIALGQSYFAVKTRQQELVDDYDRLSEEQKRVAIRQEMKKHNKSLAEAAQNAGVETPQDFAIFQNKGYQGLYGGLGKREIAKKKGLKPTADILDHMGSTELAANLFRATQTDEKLRREHIQGKAAANRTHFEVGRKVRQTIKELGGTMPEDLPTPEKSIKQIEREQKQKELKE